MRIIRPITIAPAMLTACNVLENDHAAWSAATTYAAGTRVIYSNKIYESLQAANLNKPPGANPTWWLEISATNRWKMFDAVTGSQTEKADSITFTIAPGTLFDSIAFLDVVGSEIVLTMTDPIEGVVYTETIDLVNQGNVVDGYTYFFEPIILNDAAVLLGIPPYPNASISVAVNYVGGTAKLGTVAIGMQYYLGGTLMNPTIGINDYSRKSTDDFGNYIVVQRTFSKIMTCELNVENTALDVLHRTLTQYRATPVIWIGADDYSSMIIYGFYKSFSITIPYPNDSTCSLEIEGLT